MELAEVVRRRRMARDYTTDPVDPSVVERALHRATRAPSAGFSQGWAFIVLDTPDAVRGFWSAQSDAVDAPDRWLAGMMRAPVVVVPCSVRSAYLERYSEPDKARTGLGGDASRWPMPYWHLDTAMASLLILQTVTEAGLGACFFGLVPDRVDRVRATLGLDGADAPEPIGAITIGHPAAPGAGGRSVQGSAGRRRRTPWQEVAHRGRFGAGWPHRGDDRRGAAPASEEG